MHGERETGPTRLVSLYPNTQDRLTTAEFSLAMKNAVKYAYRAIDNPAEGTIITVLRHWTGTFRSATVPRCFYKLIFRTLVRSEARFMMRAIPSS